MSKIISKLSSRKRYLQIALNSTLEEAQKIIAQVPISDRILIEAGTPLIKRYGEEGIRQIKQWYEQRIWGQALQPIGTPLATSGSLISLLWKVAVKNYSQPKISRKPLSDSGIIPYVVADLKMMDRGETEVEIAA